MGRLATLMGNAPILTNLARGYKNAEFIAESILPVVMVDQEEGKIPLYGKEEFRIHQSLRALRANSNVIPPSSKNTTSFILNEHDLTESIDYREITAAKNSNDDLEALAVEKISKIFKLRAEKEVADLLLTTGTYASGHHEALASGDRFDNTTSNVIGLIAEKVELVRSKIGVEPNTLVLSAKAYSALKTHPQLTDRLQYSNSGIITVDLLKGLFDIPNILVGKAVFSDDGNAFTDVWGNTAILAYVAPPGASGRTVHEPSFGYTLRLKGNPWVDRYQEQNGKVTKVRQTDLFTSKVVSNESAVLLTTVTG